MDKHINTSIYKEALDAVIKKNPKDKTYHQMLTFYKKNN